MVREQQVASSASILSSILIIFTPTKTLAYPTKQQNHTYAFFTT